MQALGRMLIFYFFVKRLRKVHEDYFVGCADHISYSNQYLTYMYHTSKVYLYSTVNVLLVWWCLSKDMMADDVGLQLDKGIVWSNIIYSPLKLKV